MAFTYARIFSNAVNRGDPDTAKTLKAFQKRCGIIREAVKEAKRQYDADLHRLGEELSSKAFDRERKALDDDFTGLVLLAKQRCLDDLEGVLNGKRAEFSKRSGAPTEEQLRLLTVLQMRSELTAGEIANVADKLNDSVQALRLLREIAHKHNVPFKDVANDEEFEQKLTEAEEFGKRMVDGLTKTEDKELNSYERGFFLPYDGPTAADAFFSDLDASIFTAPQKTAQDDIKPAEDKIERGAKPNAVKIYLRGDESLAGIAMQFGVDSTQIRAYNPDFDFANMSRGDSIVVPSGRLRVSDAAGSIVEGQCVPVYAEKPAPAPKSGTEIVIE